MPYLCIRVMTVWWYTALVCQCVLWRNVVTGCQVKQYVFITCKFLSKVCNSLSSNVHSTLSELCADSKTKFAYFNSSLFVLLSFYVLNLVLNFSPDCRAYLFSTVLVLYCSLKILLGFLYFKHHFDACFWTSLHVSDWQLHGILLSVYYAPPARKTTPSSPG
jgi:hypothetical protein